LKHDSVHGRLPYEVKLEGDTIIVGGNRVKVFYESDPAVLPWRKLGVFLVIEASGKFRSREGASKHLSAGASKVLISAPSKDPDLTVVMGVNEHLYENERHHIVSNASCTTNCIAPVVKSLHENFGVESGFMSTVHAYTNTQTLLDRSQKDLRRARAAATNIIPTSTGAAAAIGQVIPELEGKIDGMAFRVPLANVSLVDFVGALEKQATVQEVNEALAKSAREMEGIMAYTEEPLVSSDFIHDPHSAIVDGSSTRVNRNLVKVLAWYDNEWGYACRLVDMAAKMGRIAGY
jgi:glyceraldehyde 3-phosphate dehydrogenase